MSQEMQQQEEETGESPDFEQFDDLSFIMISHSQPDKFLAFSRSRLPLREMTTGKIEYFDSPEDAIKALAGIGEGPQAEEHDEPDERSPMERFVEDYGLWADEDDDEEPDAPEEPVQRDNPARKEAAP